MPLSNSGVTKPYYAQAQAVAAAVAAQKAPEGAAQHVRLDEPDDRTTLGPRHHGWWHSASGHRTRRSPARLVSRRADPRAPATGRQPVADAPLVKTAAVSSRTGGGLLVLLLVIAVVAGLGPSLSRTALRGRGPR